MEACENQEGSLRQVAIRFKVSRNTVRNWVGRFRQEGTLAPKPHGGGRPSRIDEAGKEFIRQQVTEQPDITLEELAQIYEQQRGVRPSLATLSRLLKALGFTRKKKTFRASEQNRPDVQAARAALEAEKETLDPTRLLFLDEFGLHLGMVRLYAWAPRKARAYGYKPLQRGPKYTGVGVLGLDGLKASTIFQGSMNGERFLSFLREQVVPHLRPGDILWMDNLPAHKVTGVREMIEATGATVRYLPPYSPDFSPVEFCWSKVKQILRRLAAQNEPALEQAAAEAFAQVTPQDAQGWFAGCGYRVKPN